MSDRQIEGDRLVSNYQAFKARLKAGSEPSNLSTMTDEHQAGLWLTMFGVGALKAFDKTGCVGLEQKFPGTRARLVYVLNSK